MSHPGPNGGNLHSCTSNGVLNSGQQDAGLHNTCLYPGPSSHPRHLSARPLFYVHAPTPPPPPPQPFLHYPWSLPMPLFYNPFEAFPGMGYGIVMPPFPPYMETPAYIVPHAQVQSVDYRRLLQPQAQVSTVPYQNPTQTRRIRPPQSVPTETVSSEVQTDPTPRSGDDSGTRSPLVCSDSGRGTASVSPSSSSSSHKRYSAEANDSESLSQKGRTLPSSNKRVLQVNNADTNETVEHGFNILHPTIKTVQSPVGETLKEQNEKANILPCRYSRCNVWSVSSSDSIVPVCSSFQQDEEERRASISKVQGLGCGPPQAHQSEQLLPSQAQTEHDQSLNQSLADADCLLVSTDGECIYKILKLPLDQSEDANESCQRSSNGFQMRKAFNESIWSVESLAPFIPTKEWLMHNGMSEPEVIAEMLAKAESRRRSMQDTTVPTDKESGETCTISPCDSGTKSSCSSEKEATLSSSPGVETVIPTIFLMGQSGVDVEIEERKCQQLCVPSADVKVTEVSPSKGHLVDCGIQCNKLKEVNCLCNEMKRSMGPSRRHAFRFSDTNTNTGSTEGFYINEHVQKNQKRPGQWRNRNSEKPSSQQVLYNGPAGKTGKRGGRNHK